MAVELQNIAIENLILMSLYKGQEGEKQRVLHSFFCYFMMSISFGRRGTKG